MRIIYQTWRVKPTLSSDEVKFWTFFTVSQWNVTGLQGQAGSNHYPWKPNCFFQYNSCVELISPQTRQRNENNIWKTWITTALLLECPHSLFRMNLNRDIYNLLSSIFKLLASSTGQTRPMYIKIQLNYMCLIHVWNWINVRALFQTDLSSKKYFVLSSYRQNMTGKCHACACGTMVSIKDSPDISPTPQVPWTTTNTHSVRSFKRQSDEYPWLPSCFTTFLVYNSCRL